jgi:hypothetical protein
MPFAVPTYPLTYLLTPNGHLFPSLEDDHAKIAAGELAIVG